MFFDTPATRVVARTLMPSTKARRINVRFSVLNLFAMLAP